jgi:hypothetical protein
MLGSVLGSADGMIDGSWLGTDEGAEDRLGKNEGLTVGISDGVILGSWLGAIEGRTDG